MKFCVKCGVALPDAEAVFCPECGVRLPAKQTASGAKEASAGQNAPRRPQVALWTAWSLVALLVVGDIALGLYFGVFRDESPQLTTATVTTAMATTPTPQAPPTTTKVAPADMLDEDWTAYNFLYSASQTAWSLYFQLDTYDPAVMTPELLNPEGSPVTFRLAGEDAAVAPTAKMSENAVDYFGTADRLMVGTVSDSGKKIGIIRDGPAGAVQANYVDGVAQDW